MTTAPTPDLITRCGNADLRAVVLSLARVTATPPADVDRIILDVLLASNGRSRDHVVRSLERAHGARHRLLQARFDLLMEQHDNLSRRRFSPTSKEH